MTASQPSTTDLEFLHSISSSEASDALIALNYAHGGHLTGLTMLSPNRTAEGASKTICGPVVTVKLVHASDTTSPVCPSQFADSSEEGQCMFISQPRDTPNAVWGGLMTTRAKVRGSAGVVVDGQIRDLSEQLKVGFPVFCRGTSTLPSKGLTRCSEINTAVEYESLLGTIVINPGDFIIGDADGVVVVPISLIAEVVRVARKKVAGDQLAMQALLDGSSVTEAFAKFR